jgi:phenylacetate-coenzyme A ligase PaaK-like adenylate-forming protein
MNPKLLTSRWQRLPEHAVLELQAEKLRHYLRTVVLPFSPYYRELFARHGIKAESIRTLEDLEQIPFTSKTDLLNTPENPQKVRDFLITPDQETLSCRPSTICRALISGRESVKAGFEAEFRPIFLTSTTGRSADPIPFLFTRHDLENLSSAGDRIMQVCGAQRDFRLLNMFPYAPHLAFWMTHYGATAFGLFCVGSGGGKVLGTDGNLRLMQKIKPDVLIGMPTFVYHVLQQAVEAGMRCDSLRRLVLGGEKAAEGIRRKLRNLAAKLGSPGVDVLSTYGFTEAKMAWAECPFEPEEASGGYHLYPDLGLFEVINPKTGAVVPQGNPGELVFTPLDGRGSVVLRYRTGDYIDGGMVYTPCPRCGRTLPRLVGSISRSSEIKSMQLDKIKGTLIDFNQLEHVLDDAPNVGAWQLELRKLNDDPMELDEITLHVHRLNGVDEEKLCRELNNRFVERTEIHPNRIVFHDAEELRRLQGVGVEMKEQKIVDHRPKLKRAEPPSVAPSPLSTEENTLPGPELALREDYGNGKTGMEKDL